MATGVTLHAIRTGSAPSGRRRLLPNRPICGSVHRSVPAGIPGLARLRFVSSHPRFMDEALIDAMMAHPILINRPIVVTPLGTRLCRPPETLLEILSQAQRDALASAGDKASI